MAVDTRYVTHDKWTGLVAMEVTYPDGRQVASGYDALYRRNAVTEVSGGGSISAWQFFGNRTATVALGNGITCSFMNDAQTHSAVQAGVPNPAWGDKSTDRLGYDGSGRMIAKRFLPSGSTTALVGFTTAYDSSSNKLYERALDAESRSGLYPGYDSMDRLLEYQRGTLASGGGSVVTPITLPGTDSQRTYDLDGLGNWKNTVYSPEGGSPTTEIRQHNKLNEITQFATTPVLYDHGNNAGNANPLIAQRGNGNIVNDGTRIYAYDALNRLVKVSSTASGTPQVAAYTYDALGRRVLKAVTNGGVANTIANATYRYLFDDQRIVEELLDASGSYSTLRQFVWGQYIDELIQLKVPTTTTTPPLTAGTYYPLQDLLYRTTATTNSSGAIVEAYDYDAYGNTLMYSGPGTDGLWFTDDDVTTLQPICEYLFTGRQYDPETEIYWYRARYYLPELGRFGGRDPIVYIGGANLYQYVRGRPVLTVDPTGIIDECPDTSAAANADVEIHSQAFVNLFANGDQWSGSQLVDNGWKAVSPDTTFNPPFTPSGPNCRVYVIDGCVRQVSFHSLYANELEVPGLEQLITKFNGDARTHENKVIAELKSVWGAPFEICDCDPESDAGELTTEHNKRQKEFNDWKRQNHATDLPQFRSDLQNIANAAGLSMPIRF